MAISETENIIKKIDYLLRGNSWNRFTNYLDELIEKGMNTASIFKRIDDLTGKISRLVMLNIQIYNINLIFDTLKDINSYNILNELNFEYKAKDFVKSDILYILLINCCNDLFGKPTEQFLAFIVKELPKFIIDYLKRDSRLFFGESIRIEDNISLIKDLLNGYTMYGLNIRKISNYRDYLEIYDTKKKSSKMEGYYTLDISKNRQVMGNYPFDFLNFSSFSETHLINGEILKKVRTKRDSNDPEYEFPIVSMIIRGGLGPQGKGFSYLTPFDEICEICSDVKENKAYVLEYKKYLKRAFINELYKIVDSWKISTKDKEKIIEFLDSNIQLNMIDSSEIDYIFNKIDKFFNSMAKDNTRVKIDQQFRSKLKMGVQKILLPIQMQDQFMLRMDLIKSETINEKEVAKIVSLGNVSHYDMLVQRFFFQNLVEFMIRELNIKKKSKRKKK